MCFRFDASADDLSFCNVWTLVITRKMLVMLVAVVMGSCLHCQGVS